MSDAGSYKYATRIVRVFPDYAESVIWFSDPFPYEDARLTTDLAAPLRKDNQRTHSFFVFGIIHYMRLTSADPEKIGSRSLVNTGIGGAEDRGFEPLRAFTQHAFQACAIGH